MLQLPSLHSSFLSLVLAGAPLLPCSCHPIPTTRLLALWLAAAITSGLGPQLTELLQRDACLVLV